MENNHNNNDEITKNEIKKFDILADQWLKQNGQYKTLYEINPLRLKFIVEKIKQHFQTSKLEDFKLLDIGCGAGLMSNSIARLGAQVTGIDASSANIEIAKEKNAKIEFFNYTVKELKNHFPNEKYDIILCLEVIEHVNDIRNFLPEVISLMRPNGMLIISTINRNKKAWLYTIAIAEYLLKWLPKNTHEYQKFVKPHEIEKIVNIYDKSIKEMKGIIFNPLLNRWQLSNDISVNYLAYIK